MWLGHHFQGQRSRSPGRFTHCGLIESRSSSGEHGNVLGVGNYCYVAVCSVVLGASAPTEGGEGLGHIVAAAHLQLVGISLAFADTAAVSYTSHLHWAMVAMSNGCHAGQSPLPKLDIFSRLWRCNVFHVVSFIIHYWWHNKIEIYVYIWIICTLL